MKVFYTERSLKSLEEVLDFLIEIQQIPIEKVIQIRDELITKTDKLTDNYLQYQRETNLKGAGKEYRRLIYNHIKVIYYCEKEVIYVVRFFDTRQDPRKMRG